VVHTSQQCQAIAADTFEAAHVMVRCAKPAFCLGYNSSSVSDHCEICSTWQSSASKPVRELAHGTKASSAVSMRIQGK
jgi:hypothetical protein